MAGASAVVSQKSSGPCLDGGEVSTRVVVERQVDPDLVAGDGRAASSLNRGATSRPEFREIPEWVHGIERRAASQKRCSFR